MRFLHIILHIDSHPVSIDRSAKVKNRAVSGLSSNNCRFVNVVVGVTMPTAFITPSSIATLAERYGWVAAIQQCVYYCKQHPPFCTAYLVYSHNNEQLWLRLVVILSNLRETRLSSAGHERLAIPLTDNDHRTSTDAKNIITLRPVSVFHTVRPHMKYKKRNHLLFRVTFPAALWI